MKLFEDKLRVDFQYPKNSENVYIHVDSSARDNIAKFRDLLNKWFEIYPSDNKQELKKNFKDNFQTAFYELFIHELFYRQGFTLIPHPMLSGSERRPDFLAKRGKEEFYIEATTVSYLSEIEIKKQNFRKQFIEELNKTNSPIFWLELETLYFKKENFPRVGQIRKEIEQQLELIEQKEFLSQNDDEFQSKVFKVENENVHIEFLIHLKSIESRGLENSRLIGLQHFPSTCIDSYNDSEKIYTSFKKKAQRYGTLNRPFIVCLNIDFGFNLIHDVDESFYNSNCFHSHKAKFTKVSAVLINQISFSNIFKNNKHRLIVNPHSEIPIDINSLELSYERQENEIIKKKVNEIIDLCQ